MENLRLFSTQTEYNTVSGDLKYPTVSYITATDTVIIEGYDYSRDYLTLEALESGDITINIGSEIYGSSYMESISWSKDQETWNTTTMTSSAQTITIPVNVGDEVYLKGTGKQTCKPNASAGYNGSYYSFSNTNNFTWIVSDCDIIAKGNIMSLFYGDDFSDKTSFPTGSTCNLSTLFSIPRTGNTLPTNTHLVGAENLVLPATTLTSQCYSVFAGGGSPQDGCQSGMFCRCTNLTSIPKLPATTLVNGCYQHMFNGCTSITSIPNDLLPATNLANYCYCKMFNDCTALRVIPSNLLPATTMADHCYYNMFQGCTSLTTAPLDLLPATTLANYCYSSMFQNCTSLTSVPTLNATTMANFCYWCMFSGCTSLTTAPVLPATTLARSCYYQMFNGCTSLTTAPTLPATTLAMDCYYCMFKGCTALTTAPVISATTLASGCYRNMFDTCTSLTTVPSNYLPVTTLVDYCYDNMFKDCTALTTAPDLPATTLVDHCYYYMFQNCTNLNYIKAMFTTTPANTYTERWVMRVAATGTFVKNSTATWTDIGLNAVPSGWTVQTASS